MVVFIDNLAYSLFMISFAGFMLLYLISTIYLDYRKKKKEFSLQLNSAAVPLFMIALYMVVGGLWGQFNWPLPGSYNILFYDPFISFGLVIAAFVASIKFKTKFSFVGFFALLVGIMVIIYGIVGYNLGLTSAPIALLIMYFLYGLAGICAYPVSLIIERLPGMQKSVWVGWSLFLLLFWVLLLFGSLLAGYVGIAAIPAHLLSAP